MPSLHHLPRAGVIAVVMLLFANRAEAASLPVGAQLAKRTTVSGKKPSVKPGGTPVVLYHVNHHETLVLRFADDRGRPVKGFQARFDNFLRCHYTKRRHAMNPRLARLLLETGRHFPGRRIEVVSGYRHPKFAKNPKSPHKKGLACDVRVTGVANADLRDFFRQRFKNVGVGYYPNSSFVHLDVRRGASAFWIDYSGPGETALYSKNALDDLRTGRADRFRFATIDPSWADEDETAGAKPAPAPSTGEAGDDGDADGEEATSPSPNDDSAPELLAPQAAVD
jgi:uncharacterized protein YcbK (DUF882 family)